METERKPFGRGCPVVTAFGTVATLTTGPSATAPTAWYALDRNGYPLVLRDSDIVGPLLNCPPRLAFSADRVVDATG